MVKVSGLYSGKLEAFGPRGKLSGINKQIQTQVVINELGIVGDHQADKKVHGGLEKALHQFSLDSYKILAHQYPDEVDKFVPGASGENLSTPELKDADVCIGDIYQVGKVLLQVSQPRIPCWKIAHKYGVSGLDKFVAQQRICGWYYRVLNGGTVELGDEVSLLERRNPDVFISHFMAIKNKQITDKATINKVMGCEGLAPEWLPRLQKRFEAGTEN